jgi:hypothetical protein
MTIENFSAFDHSHEEEEMRAQPTLREVSDERVTQDNKIEPDVFAGVRKAVLVARRSEAPDHISSLLGADSSPIEESEK